MKRFILATLLALFLAPSGFAQEMTNPGGQTPVCPTPSVYKRTTFTIRDNSPNYPNSYQISLDESGPSLVDINGKPTPLAEKMLADISKTGLGILFKPDLDSPRGFYVGATPAMIQETAMRTLVTKLNGYLGPEYIVTWDQKISTFPKPLPRKKNVVRRRRK